MAWTALTLLTALTALFRLLPHAPNFTPVGALALFVGAYAPRRWGVVLPLTAMLVADAAIGFYDWRVMLSVYGSFALSVGLGYLLRDRVSAAGVAFASISASLVFFFATNFAVWLFSGMYPMTGEGLMLCYTLALPFLRPTLLGDAFFSAAFFGGFALARKAADALVPAGHPAPHNAGRS